MTKKLKRNYIQSTIAFMLTSVSLTNPILANSNTSSHIIDEMTSDTKIEGQFNIEDEPSIQTDLIQLPEPNESPPVNIYENTSLDLDSSIYNNESQSNIVTQNKYLNIDISPGGQVILNEGLPSEITVSSELSSGQKKLNVYDNNNNIIDIITSNYTDYQSLYYTENDYVYEVQNFDTVDVKIVANEGYEITSFDVLNENINFIGPQKEVHHLILMNENKSLISNFEKTSIDTNYDTKQPIESDLYLSNTTNLNSNTYVIDDNLNNSSDRFLNNKSLTDSCYILDYEISDISDGTAPFDENNNPGNDSNSKNGIIRSFDSINYTLKYTTAIKNLEQQIIDSTNVMIDFLLPCSPLKAEFNVDTMKWILDKQITYNYADGTSSCVYDKSKDVVSQRLTGKRFLINNESGVTVPGTGTLAIGVNVNAAISGDIIKPQFTIWMEGNSDAEKKTASTETIVSSAPKFDIVLARNELSNILGYYNPITNTAKLKNPDAGDKYGRLQSYVVGLTIQNDFVEKGMKGIEYPDGSDITFDLRMAEEVNGLDVSKQDSYNPILWDYAMDTGIKDVGNLGRIMSPFDQSIASYGGWVTNTPYNIGKREIVVVIMEEIWLSQKTQ